MSFPAYPGYQDSGVEWIGTIPATWKLQRLKHVASLNPPKSEISGLADDTQVSFLPMEAIGETGEIDTSRTRPLAEVRNGYSYFANGDVVFAKVTPCFENGKGALLDGLVSGCGFGTTELTVLRPRRSADADFLRWLILSDLFRGPGSGEMVGAGGLKRVPDDFVANFPVPWPSASERYSIVAFLDRETAKIDALVEEQRLLVELLEEKRRAVISRALIKGLDPKVSMKDTGVDLIGEVPSHWDCRRLRFVAELNPSKSQIGHLPDDIALSFIPMEAISERGELDLSRTRALGEIRNGYSYFADGDVVFAKVTPCFENGKGALMRGLTGGHGFGTTELTVIRPRDASDAPFLYWVTCAPIFREPGRAVMTGAGGLKRVPDDFVADFLIPWPPARERRGIVAFLDQATSKFDALSKQAEQLIAILKERRAALISAAVTGKIDVRLTENDRAEAA